MDGEDVVSLKENALEAPAVKLLAGLLRHNRVLTDLDLTATDIDPIGALAIAATLETNKVLTALRMKFNPAIDEQAKAALKASAASRSQPPLLLEL